jgi:hypothetical protein
MLSNRIFAVFIPSFILLSAATWTALPELRPYREVFGNDNYYLDLYYEVNPQGWLRQGQPDQPVRFHGRLTTNSGDYPIEGARQGSPDHAHYEFKSKAGQFVGQLSKNGKGCEPSLHFRLQGAAEPSASGILRAGFCTGG